MAMERFATKGGSSGSKGPTPGSPGYAFFVGLQRSVAAGGVWAAGVRSRAGEYDNVPNWLNELNAERFRSGVSSQHIDYVAGVPVIRPDLPGGLNKGTGKSGPKGAGLSGKSGFIGRGATGSGTGRASSGTPGQATFVAPGTRGPAPGTIKPGSEIGISTNEWLFAGPQEQGFIPGSGTGPGSTPGTPATGGKSSVKPSGPKAEDTYIVDIWQYHGGGTPTSGDGGGEDPGNNYGYDLDAQHSGESGPKDPNAIVVVHDPFSYTPGERPGLWEHFNSQEVVDAISNWITFYGAAVAIGAGGAAAASGLAATVVSGAAATAIANWAGYEYSVAPYLGSSGAGITLSASGPSGSPSGEPGNWIGVHADVAGRLAGEANWADVASAVLGGVYRGVAGKISGKSGFATAAAEAKIVSGRRSKSGLRGGAGVLPPSGQSGNWAGAARGESGVAAVVQSVEADFTERPPGVSGTPGNAFWAELKRELGPTPRERTKQSGTQSDIPGWHRAPKPKVTRAEQRAAREQAYAKRQIAKESSYQLGSISKADNVDNYDEWRADLAASREREAGWHRFLAGGERPSGPSAAKVAQDARRRARERGAASAITPPAPGLRPDKIGRSGQPLTRIVTPKATYVEREGLPGWDRFVRGTRTGSVSVIPDDNKPPGKRGGRGGKSTLPGRPVRTEPSWITGTYSGAPSHQKVPVPKPQSGGTSASSGAASSSGASLSSGLGAASSSTGVVGSAATSASSAATSFKTAPAAASSKALAAGLAKWAGLPPTERLGDSVKAASAASGVAQVLGFKPVKPGYWELPDINGSTTSAFSLHTKTNGPPGQKGTPALDGRTISGLNRSIATYRKKGYDAAAALELAKRDLAYSREKLLRGYEHPRPKKEKQRSAAASGARKRTLRNAAVAAESIGNLQAAAVASRRRAKPVAWQ